MSGPVSSQSASAVLTGLDALYRNQLPETLALLRGQRLGLLTNHTGRTTCGKNTLEALRDLDYTVRALFSPEHGIEGQREGNIESGQTADKLPIHSLYGQTRRPTPEMLEGIDLLVCDLQDVGARFYTYASTLAHCLEECAPRGIGVVVLDRPNPIGGETIEGPLIDKDARSFIGYLDIPIRHGLTLGEMALLFCNDAEITAQLHVAPVLNWNRRMLWPETELQWPVPSPNLPDFQSAAWYPGTCLLEFSKLSVGRGTRAPFQIIGAPWLEPCKVLRALENEPIFTRMFRAEPMEFTPTRGEYTGELCRGLQFHCAGTQNIVPAVSVPLGLVLLSALHRAQPAEFDVEKLQLALPLLGAQEVLSLLREGRLQSALEIAENDAENFRSRRKPFLLYE